MKAIVNQSERLMRVLQALFTAQARDAMSKVRLDGDAPDLTPWVKIIAEVSKPVLLQLTQQGMVTSAARIAAKLGVRPNISATPPQSEGMRTYRPGNDAIFGKRLARAGVATTGVGRGLTGAPARTSLFLKGGRRVVCKAAGKPGLTMDFDLFDPRVLDAVDQAAFAFCRETMETTTTDLKEALEALRLLMREGLSRGDAIQLLAKKVREIFADPARAFRIATTETSRAIHSGNRMAAAESGVVTGFTWLSSSDACKLCLSLDGKTVKEGEPYYIDPKGKHPYNVVLHPPAHPHCLLPETPVIVSGSVGAFKAFYSGTCYRITLVNGDEFSCTPNHMLLTRSGLLCAKDVVEGDSIVYSRLREGVSRCGPHNERRPRLAEEVFDTLAVSDGMATRRVPASAEDLHGDAVGCQGDIYIVKAYRLLRGERHVAVGFNEPPDEPVFQHRQRTVGEVEQSSSFNCGSEAQLGIILHRLASLCSVGSSRHRHALLLADSRKRLALTPDFDTTLPEDAYDRCVGTPKQFADDAGSDPLAIEVGNLLDVGSVELVTCRHVVPFQYNGFVYDFQTSSSLYQICNGLINSNCFCDETEEVG